ncbi:phosphoribosylamine--glycine ligase [uncultured Anaerococcus sp.]|uniref:phosphoribosylamine--glycine ligase n=1 Tax=uncultured Anaerococcus sp. TaxID=293428 RepID=UPI0025D01E15|nr:phosphoribosylamine--glycine ligase [uncultured Anaerococcus sp.]
MKRVLVVGNGGREHAISDKLYREGHKVYMVGENPGVARIGTCIDIEEEKLADFCKEKNIDLVIIGPEAYLVDGLVDKLEKEGIRVFGPNKKASILEGSKAFAKDLMKKYDIPTATYEIFTDYKKALAYIEKSDFPLVIKADGIAAGKGVIIAQNLDQGRKALREIMVDQKFKGAGGSVVIEEFLEGEEFSLLALVSGDLVIPLRPVQDHKRAFDKDLGPNTGGMGVYMPIKSISDADIDEAIENILRPTAEAMTKEGRPFKGILFAGLMKTKDGVKTIEYNVRFGDPETEIILMDMETNLYDLIEAVLEGREVEIKWKDKAHIGVVLASKGYPEAYKKGFEIKGLDNLTSKVFHMGTKEDDGKIITNGGRVLIVCAEGDDLKEARDKAYQDIEKIKCDNLFFRTDIGHLSLK